MYASSLAAIIFSFVLQGIIFAHDHSRPKSVIEAPRIGAAAPKDRQGLSCLLTIELKDAKSGVEQAGLIRISDSSGKYLSLPELTDRCIGLRGEARKLGWHVLTGKTALQLPRAQLKLEALSGLESELADVSLDLRGKTSAEQGVELKHFFDAKQMGLVSGNTHLHLMNLSRAEADTYLQSVPRGDGIDLVFVSYLERAGADKAYISNEYNPDALRALSSKAVSFSGGEEYRHNLGGGGEGYGHVMFLNLKNRILPASLGPGITKTGTDATPLRSGLREARSQGGTIVWCHNAFGFEDIPSWVEELVDAQNIFDGGTHGDYSDTFYRYLNAGYRVPFSTGTDWFIYDFSRVYVPLTKEEVNAEDWLRVLASGQSVITNSALLTLDVAEEKPGGTVLLKNPGKVSVKGTAVGRVDFGRLQLIRNGEVIAEVKSVQNGGHFEALIEVQTTLDQPAWLALRIAPADDARNELEQRPFAHTSPVYVKIKGESVFQPQAVEDLIAEIRSSIRSVQENGEFKSDNERGAVLGVYHEGIKKLERRLQDFSQRK